MNFAIICCPVMALTHMTEKRSNKQIESRSSATGNWHQAESRQVVDCFGRMEQRWQNILISFCPARNNPGLPTSGNYVVLHGVGTHTIRIFDVATGHCTGRRNDCTCHGLLGVETFPGVRLLSSADTIRLTFVRGLGNQGRDDACTCYLGGAKAAYFHFVTITDCPELGTFKIEPEYPCKRIFEICPNEHGNVRRFASEWVITKV